MLSIYRRGKIWHYRGTIGGRRLRGTTGTADKGEAARLVARLQSKAWERDRFGPQAVLTFARAALHYRNAGNWSRYLEMIEDHWKNALVSKMTPGLVRQAALDLYPDAKASTQNRSVIVPTRAVINHCADLGLCAPIKIKGFREDPVERKPATWEWIQAFMTHATPETGALACFMFCTGARIGESFQLTWSDVDLSSGRATIRQTKVANVREAHLQAPLVAALASLEGERVGRVFGYKHRATMIRRWDQAIEAAGIEPLTPHSCRHGFATAMLQAGVDPVTIAKRGGWASAQLVLSTYGHASEDATITDLITDTPLTQKRIKSLKA